MFDDFEEVEMPTPRPKVKEIKQKPPPHERAYWINLTIEMLGKNTNTGKEFEFGHVLGLTRNWPLQWIIEMYSVCSKSDNPARLWFGLIKKQKNE